jgi:hypothetical protein
MCAGCWKRTVRLMARVAPFAEQTECLPPNYTGAVCSWKRSERVRAGYNPATDQTH